MGFISAMPTIKVPSHAKSHEPKSAFVLCFAEKTGPRTEVIRELKGGTAEWRRCGGGEVAGREAASKL